MASPQCENGYTRFANELLDAMIRTRLPGQEIRVMLAVARKTYGFGKKEDQISYGQLAKLTDIPRSRVIEHVKSLVSKKGLGSLNNGTRKPPTLWINKDFEQWMPSPKKETSPNHETIPSPNHVSNLVPITRPTKERKKKEKEIRVVLPDWIPLERYREFLEMRKKIKKPATPRAEQLIIKELAKLKEQGFEPVEVLEQSIRNDWQDVYPIKEKGYGNKANGGINDNLFLRTVREENERSARKRLDGGSKPVQRHRDSKGGTPGNGGVSTDADSPGCNPADANKPNG